MLYVKGADNIDSNAKLGDQRIIKEIAAKCGFRIRNVPAPSQESDENESLVSK